MIRLTSWLIFCGVAVLPAIATAQAVLLGPVANPSNGHAYYLLEPATWTASEAAAVNLGGHLATIRSAAEQTWVFDTFKSVGGVDRSLWIGLNDAAAEGTFVWASGESPAYTNWLPGQPDNFSGFQAAGEDFVHMLKVGNGFGHPPGFWNDMDDADSFFQLGPSAGVVEVVPEPCGFGLLCVGVIAFVSVRRGWVLRAQ